MAVSIRTSHGVNSREEFNDEGGKEYGYRINANGSLVVVVKKSDKISVHREYGPNGYVWVDGKRFVNDVDKQQGTDGKLTQTASKMQVL